MGTTFVVVLFILLTTIAAVLYFLPAAPGTQLSTEFRGPFSLSSEPTSIVSKDDGKFWANAPKSTIQFFIFLSPMKRTSIKHMCAETPTQGMANCDTERFPVCNCGGSVASPTDCSPCVHKDYYQFFSVFDIIQLEISTLPDASRQLQPSMQLIVRTETPNPGNPLSIQSHIETLPLPPILYQKWTMITITREGRRFDIYYNDKLVLSTLTLNRVSQEIWNTDKGITIGNEYVMGEIAYFSLKGSLYNSINVSAAYKKYADTRGRPYLPTTTESSTTNPTDPFAALSICPTGSCFQAPKIRPSSPLLNWTTNYG